MAYEITRSDSEVLHVQVSGIIKLKDHQSLQEVGRELITQGGKLKILVTLENFQGWEKGVDWSDVGFLIAYGNDITRLAITGDERWKDEIFAFVAKGLRTTEIEFFPASRKREAETWLNQ